MSIRDMLVGLKQHFSTLNGEVGKVNARLEKLKREREELEIRPVMREDLYRILSGIIDEKQTKQFSKMQEGLQGYITSKYTEPGLAASHSKNLSWLLEHPSRDVGLDTLALLFPDALKEGLKRALDRMEWPKDAIPLDKRNALLEQLDTSIGDLEAELDELYKTANEAVLAARPAGVKSAPPTQVNG